MDRRTGKAAVRAVEAIMKIRVEPDRKSGKEKGEA